MSKKNVTPWFDQKQQPVRPGIYEVDCDYPGLHFSHFDGRNWNGAWSSWDSARAKSDWYSQNGNAGAAEVLVRWRGLAADPSKAAA